VYVSWKTVTISHTIPDFPKILGLGTSGMIAEIEAAIAADPGDHDRNISRRAFILTLEGLTAYAQHLSEQAARDASGESAPARKGELEHLAAICSRVVAQPARTLDEAVNAIWITWVGLHMESTNAGLSLGRLDQYLQPLFAADMAGIDDAGERQEYTRHAIEIAGDLRTRCTDHLPLTPDLANHYFGGASSVQAITLGGVTPEGEDAVNDMTYVFLKAAEMLSLRDPNVNARYNLCKNSDTYLRRLCEVNLITAATPSMHNDDATFATLAQYGYAQEDVRDGSATGCVEPTLSGKHMGHSGSQMLSLVAASEMALHNGRHPLMDWKVGPDTGVVERGDSATFDDFFEAYRTQLAFLVDQAVPYTREFPGYQIRHRDTPRIRRPRAISPHAPPVESGDPLCRRLPAEKWYTPISSVIALIACSCRSRC
jgi:formate C-acetyltransferase